MKETMPVHVSIHDVAPCFAAEVELALELCAAADVTPALLVVPNYHGESALLDDAGFCARLRELQGAGHEVYLHGFFHQSRPRYEANGGGRGVVARARWLFAQRVVSGGEAEYSDVSPEEARARLDRGERVLQDAGLSITGFVAPAWSMPRWLLPNLAERGYRFAEDHTRVYDPARGRSRASVVLNWASRSPGRLASTVAYCRVAKLAKAFIPARVAIHPADIRFRVLRHEVMGMLAWAKGDVVARGADLFE